MKNTIRKIASSWYDANGKLKLPRLHESNFDNLDIKKHKGKSIVIFSADWCPYCVSFFNPNLPVICIITNAKLLEIQNYLKWQLYTSVLN